MQWFQFVDICPTNFRGSQFSWMPLPPSHLELSSPSLATHWLHSFTTNAQKHLTLALIIILPWFSTSLFHVNSQPSLSWAPSSLPPFQDHRQPTTSCTPVIPIHPPTHTIITPTILSQPDLLSCSSLVPRQNSSQSLVLMLATLIRGSALVYFLLSSLLIMYGQSWRLWTSFVTVDHVWLIITSWWQVYHKKKRKLSMLCSFIALSAYSSSRKSALYNFNAMAYSDKLSIGKYVPWF